MNSVICTLFEGHFHYGVAALINSVFKQGFYGEIFIGYRGESPIWANTAISNDDLNWPDAKTFTVSANLKIHFLPIDTTDHFTNYKAQFIVKVWEQCVTDPAFKGIVYFDPDIINKCSWQYYEQWITYGVALVHEIVWNDMPPTHPKRHQWASVSNKLGYKVNHIINAQINAGFIGVSAGRIGFIKMWDRLIDQAVLNFNFDRTKLAQNPGNTGIFSAGDQDLLNLTAMCTTEDISEFGPEGMDFISGGWLMSHATGSPKPWNKKFILSALNGKPPTRAEKAYWENVDGPIKCYPAFKVKSKRISILLSSFIGRFYARI